MNYNRNIDYEGQIPFERMVLSSLLFEQKPNALSDVINFLSVNDFVLPQHGLIYEAIVTLFKQDKPVDEHFIKKVNDKIDDYVILEILSTNPAKNIFEYAKEIKKNRITLDIRNIAGRINEGDYSLIDSLISLQNQILAVDHSKQLKDFDDHFEEVIQKFDLKPFEIEKNEVQYLYKNLIVSNEITMIVARPETGKSLIAVALCLFFLKRDKIKRVFYLDGDNSVITIKSRNIHKIKAQFEHKFHYFVGKTYNELSNLLILLKKHNLQGCVVVLDSIKNFIIGDRNSHKDVTQIMDELKILRNHGSTVIFLHHQNKLNKDFNSAFAGSSAFTEDVANAFELKKNNDKSSYILHPIKDRNNLASAVAFQVLDDLQLKEIDVGYAMETNEEVSMKEEIQSFIHSCKEKPSYSEIMRYMHSIGFLNKDKVNKCLQNGKDRHWKATSVPNQNNKQIYVLLDSADNSDSQDDFKHGDRK